MEDDAYRDDQSIQDWFSDNNNGRRSYRAVCERIGLYPNGQPGQASILLGIEDFVNECVATGLPAFLIEQVSKRKQSIHPYSLASHLRFFREYLSVVDGYHDYSEHIQIFIEACRYAGFISGYFPGPMVIGLESPTAQHCEAMNRVVSYIRNGFSRTIFSRMADDRRYQSSLKEQSITRYAWALREYYCRLSVVRLDFGYRDECQGFITIDHVYAHIDALLKAMANRHPIFEHKVGYAWSIEQGTDGKGYHLHVVVFFLGWEVRDDVYKSHQIGQFWVENITSGMGTYFSCNAKKAEYRVYQGTGLFQRGDSDGWEDVVYCLSYLVKDDDQHLRMRPRGARTFSTGRAPDLADKRGRPPA
jgi:hypothetical protein